MKTTIHGKNLIQLTQWGAFNCYLVRENDGLTLIDTLLANFADDILHQAKQFGEIKRVIVTHGHSDHVGGLEKILRQVDHSVDLLLTKRQATFLAGDHTLLPTEAQAKPKSMVTVNVQASSFYTETEMIGSLQAIAAPGHSPDQMAFLDTRDQTLIAGDAFQTQGKVAVSGKMVWRFPFMYFSTWHKPTALETAKKLRALNPSRLAIGHGRVIETPDLAMKTAIEAGN